MGGEGFLRNHQKHHPADGLTSAQVTLDAMRESRGTESAESAEITNAITTSREERVD